MCYLLPTNWFAPITGTLLQLPQLPLHLLPFEGVSTHCTCCNKKNSTAITTTKNCTCIAIIYCRSMLQFLQHIKYSHKRNVFMRRHSCCKHTNAALSTYIYRNVCLFVPVNSTWLLGLHLQLEFNGKSFFDFFFLLSYKLPQSNFISSLATCNIGSIFIEV